MTYTDKAKEWLDGRIPPDATQAEYQWFRSGALTFASFLDGEERPFGIYDESPERDDCCDKCGDLDENGQHAHHVHCQPRKEDKLEVVPSPRLDWCWACKTEHGYHCPKEDKPVCLACQYNERNGNDDAKVHTCKPCKHEWVETKMMGDLYCKKCGHWKPQPKQEPIKELDENASYAEEQILFVHLNRRKINEVIRRLNTITK